MQLRYLEEVVLEPLIYQMLHLHRRHLRIQSWLEQEAHNSQVSYAVIVVQRPPHLLYLLQAEVEEDVITLDLRIKTAEMAAAAVEQAQVLVEVRLAQEA